MAGLDLRREDDILVRMLREVRPPNLDEIIRHHDDADKAYANRLWGAASSETRKLFVALLRGIREVATAAKVAPAFQVVTGDTNLINNLAEAGLLSVEEKDAVLRRGYCSAHPDRTLASKNRIALS